MQAPSIFQFVITIWDLIFRVASPLFVGNVCQWLLYWRSHKTDLWGAKGCSFTVTSSAQVTHHPSTITRSKMEVTTVWNSPALSPSVWGLGKNSHNTPQHLASIMGCDLWANESSHRSQMYPLLFFTYTREIWNSSLSFHIKPLLCNDSMKGEHLPVTHFVRPCECFNSMRMWLFKSVVNLVFKCSFWSQNAAARNPWCKKHNKWLRTVHSSNGKDRVKKK